MARMIPPTISPDCASVGERKIFMRLKSDPGADKWIVLHSLDIANHRKRISGEIDFLIIIPGKGILVVEVKACSYLERRGGLWYYGADPSPDPRGPFRQASEAMHSVRTKLAGCRPDFSHILFWTGVVFPYVEFRVTSEEWHPWQVVDNRGFRSQPLSSLFCAILDNARTYVRKRHFSWFRPELQEPTDEQCDKIAKLLRPDFEFYESPGSRTKRHNEELKKYTEEQFVVLDAMESNLRVAFTGPAGTGKTLLAIETSRRGRSAGRQVLMICFNRILGKWLEDQTADLQLGIVCRTLHSHMLAVVGCSLTGQENENFWKEELPLLAMEKLLEDPQGKYVFDEIVLDEAQDIVICDNYLDFLDLSLKGGLASGRWRFFGDFEKQAIYGKMPVSLGELLDKRAGNVPIYSLRVNCRNAPRIASFARLLGGLDPDYSKILRPDNNIDPELRYYSDNNHQQVLLVEMLKKLYSEEYTGNDIVILSTKADASCAAASVCVSPWKERLRPLRDAYKGYIGYCTIHAFKGMEKPAVIVTDIDRIAGLTAESIFYVAVTRALQRLEILAQESAKGDVVNTILNRPNKRK